MSSNVSLFIGLWSLGLACIALHRIGMRYSRMLLQVALGGLVMLNAWRPLLLAILQLTPNLENLSPQLPILAAPRILGPVIYVSILLVASYEGPFLANLLTFNISIVAIIAGIIYVAVTLVLGPIVLDTSPSLGPALVQVGFRQHAANIFAFIVGIYVSSLVYRLTVSRRPQISPWVASGAVMLGGWIESILFTFGGYWGTPWWRVMVQAEFWGWTLASIALWPMVAGYLRYLQRRKDWRPGEGGSAERPALEVVRETLDLRKTLEESKRRLFRLSEAFKLHDEIRNRILISESLQAMAQETCDILVGPGGYDLAWVGLLQEPQQEIVPAAYKFAADRDFAGKTFPWEGDALKQCPCASAWRRGQVVVVADITRDRRFPSWRESAQAEAFRSCAAIPMRLEDQVIGVLNIYSEQPGSFGEQVLDALQAIADDVAVAIERLKLEQQRSQLLRELNAISHLTVDMISDQESTTLFISILEKATQLLNADQGSMYLRTAQGAWQRFVEYFPDDETVESAHPQVDEECAMRAASKGEPLVIPDYRLWPEADAKEIWHFRSYIAAPMVWHGEITGVIQISRQDETNPFSDADLELLMVFANQATVAFQNARLVESTKTRLQQSSLLNQITQKMLSSNRPQDWIQYLADQLRDLLAADSCYVAVWEAQEGKVSVHAASGSVRLEDLTNGINLNGEASFQQAILGSSQAVVVNDLTSSTLIDAGTAKSLAPLRSLVAVAFLHRDTCLGAAVLGYENSSPTLSEKAHLLESAAAQISLSLATMISYRSERRRSEELEALRKASLSLTSSLELQTVLETILEFTLDLITADDAHIFLYDGEVLRFGAARWAGNVRREPYSEPRENGLTYMVARSGERCVINQVNQHALFKDYPWGGAIVGIPLKAGQRVLGVMNVAFLEPHVFRESELRVLQLLADQAALAIENVRLYEESESERQRLKLLYAIAQELARTLDPQEILQRAVSLICANLQGQSCEAFIIDPQTGQLRLAASARIDGISLPDLEGLIEQHQGPGLIRWIAEHQQPVLIPDVQQDERWIIIPGVDENIHSALCIPIVEDEELQAVIGVFHPDTNVFRRDHLNLLVAIGHQVSLALSNARRYQQIDRRLAELTALRQVAQVVSRSLEMRQLLQEVVLQVASVLGYPVVEIYLVEESELVLGAAYGGLGDEATRIPLSSGVVGRAARESAPRYVPDVRKDPDYYPAWKETQAEIAVPLKKEDVVIGVLNVESPVLGGLTEDDLRLLTLLADNISVAVENAALYDRLRRYADDLERTVSDRTAELAEALAKAQEADKLKTRFVSDVSHELRTPLSNITLYLELLAHGKAERQVSYLETLNRETARLVVLIEDLLTVSRLDAGTATMHPRSVDINQIAEKLVEDRKRLYAENRLSVGLELDEELPHVYVDEQMLSRVVANLMTNAMNYTPAGGRVTISTERRQDSDRSWAVLTVTDDGLGISNKEQERLFQRFFRGSASRKMGTPGTGLGLAICEEIMTRHSGHITVSSREGEGSAFTIWLPLGEKPE